jgi:hypothetical protein
VIYVNIITFVFIISDKKIGAITFVLTSCVSEIILSFLLSYQTFFVHSKCIKCGSLPNLFNVFYIKDPSSDHRIQYSDTTR